MKKLLDRQQFQFEYQGRIGLDHLAARYLGYTERFWQLADVNNAMRAEALVEEIGRRLIVSLLPGVAPVLAALAEKNVLGGFDLSEFASTDALLVCVTETKTDADIDSTVAAFAEVMA